MVSINGNFGLFGNDGNRKVQKTDVQKQAEVKSDVPVGKSEHVEHKDFGDDLLTSNFYPDIQFSAKVKNTRLGKLNDLEQMSELSKLVDASKADRADKNTAYNAIEGNDWSSWLVKANMYGKLNDKLVAGFNGGAVQMQKLNELQGLA